jgi:hypothetical protein
MCLNLERKACLSDKKQSIFNFLVRGVKAMDSIAAERLRSNSSPEETSVSAIIAQYLIKNSQTFKELAELRAKVY